MPIATINIINFRNLRQISLDCSPRLNMIVGANAAGKTSFLEAIYYISLARSFRTQTPADLIHSGASAFRIVVMLHRADGQHVPVGLERSAGQLIARIDGESIRALAELAVRLPVLLLSPASHRLLEDGPQQRRRFMDWGSFHADPAFLPAWKRYQVSLRQRNAALRAGTERRGVAAWDADLVATADILDRLRGEFCRRLTGALSPLLAATLGAGFSIELEYYRGWNRERELADVLRAGYEQDRQCGYTRSGPQRADFMVSVAGHVASDYLSRGQQKLLVVALVLAQAQLYRELHDAPCILLIDDLPAELDPLHRGRIMECLVSLDTQLFISALEPALLDTSVWCAERRIIKLVNGVIEEVV
ncbi:MAG: DNA replication/repair protein RecF [Gammaproteobacteria bacterium]